MSYQIDIPPAVQKEIKALPGHVRAQARQLFDELKSYPRPARAKELRERIGIYRIWLETRWRVVYEVDDDRRVVTILRVRRKDDIDYETV